MQKISSTANLNIQQTQIPTAQKAKLLKLNDEINVQLVLSKYNSTNNYQNKYEYECLLQQIKQRQNDVNFLLELLKQLKTCVDQLEPKIEYESLINMLMFDIKWHLHSSNDQLLNNLSEFLIDLISSYTNYIYKSLTFLIKSFTITMPPPPGDGGGSENTKIDTNKLYNFSHNLISYLLKLSPTTIQHLVKLIDQLSPYMTKDVQIHESYYLNVLRLIDYLPQLRLSLFEIIIQKLLKIDVNAPRDQIINAEIEGNELAKPTTGSTNEANQTMKHPFAERLDRLMLILLNYINSKCISNKNDVDWEACKTIYKEFLFTFDRYILRTYGSSHVQFVLFYICSYRQALSEGFLDYLWKKFSNASTCPITRQLCAFYIGSYLSRASYLPLNAIIASLQLMVNWIHNYLDKIDASKSYANLDIHRTFYALCQSLFYVFVFRHHELVTTSLDLVKTWKLSSIVQSKLNPLKYCLPTITEKFASITRLYQIAYCYTIIDQNNRLKLPTSDQTLTTTGISIKKLFDKSASLSTFNDIDTKTATGDASSTANAYQDNPLDSFFPFDPYLLQRSSIFIEKLYKKYKDESVNGHDDDDDEEEMETDSDDTDDGDEDDDDESHGDKNESTHPWSEDD